MPRGLRCEPVSDGGAPAVRVVARDWPWAVPTSLVMLLIGLPMLAWSAVNVRAVEGGGAVVFTGLGLFTLWLGAARRRDVLVLRESGAVRVRGHEGVGPLSKPIDLAMPADAVAAVLPFEVPDGAPDIADRGGDLVLSGGGTRLHLARRVGPGWRDDLEAAALVLRTALSKGDGTALRP
ncbi:MAG: hypothetical protein K8T90_12285 [Planctomycetes bacterium]|nr:hypothetical protein [Planctomycetota bacterium]